EPAPVHLLGIDSAGRRRPRDVWLLRRTKRAAKADAAPREPLAARLIGTPRGLRVVLQTSRGTGPGEPESSHQGLQRRPFHSECDPRRAGREGGRVLQRAGDGGAVDQRRQDRGQVDRALVHYLPGERGPPAAPRAGPMCRELMRAALTSPLVLFIDDLHAAHPSSLLLLEFLGPLLGQARILVVGAVRDHALTTSHPCLK